MLDLNLCILSGDSASGSGSGSGSADHSNTTADEDFSSNVNSGFTFSFSILNNNGTENQLDRTALFHPVAGVCSQRKWLDQSVNPVKKGRRGPKSRSSQYRGVTCYRRTGRWESHIWLVINQQLLCFSYPFSNPLFSGYEAHDQSILSVHRDNGKQVYLGMIKNMNFFKISYKNPF